MSDLKNKEYIEKIMDEKFKVSKENFGILLDNVDKAASFKIGFLAAIEVANEQVETTKPALPIDSISFSLLAKAEANIDEELERNWRELKGMADEEGLRSVEGYAGVIKKLDARKYQIGILRAMADES